MIKKITILLFVIVLLGASKYVYDIPVSYTHLRAHET